MAANLQNLNWDDLRVLRAFATNQSLAVTARALRLNATTVSRRLKSLERSLGAPLLLQDGKSIALSTLGGRVVEAARKMHEAAGTLADEVLASETRIEGTVRLTAVPLILNKLVIPQLSSLRSAHPALQLQLLASSRNLALGRDDADVAIRLGRPARAELVGRKLFDVPYVLAGPQGKGWFTWSSAYDALPEAAWVREHVRPSEIAYRGNDTEQMADAARSGLARALIPRFLCHGMRQSKVVLVREAWLVLHKDTRDVPRIRALADWLVASRRDFEVRCAK